MDAKQTLARKEAQVAECEKRAIDHERLAQEHIEKAAAERAQAEIARAEIRGFQEALSLQERGAKSLAPILVRHRSPPPAAKVRRGRELSPVWKGLLREMATSPNDAYTIETIHEYCTSRGLRIEKKRVRSQMSRFVKRNYAIRISDGEFRIGPKGGAVAK